MIDWNHTAFALVVAIHNGADEEVRRMVAELTPSDLAGVAVILAMSLDEAWIDLCERDGVEFMLEEYETGPSERCWDTGAREKPYGRGINFEITVVDIAPLLTALQQAAWPLFFGREERWYRISVSEETGVHQFLVQDPDGYLLRFSQPLGRRLLSA